MAGSYFFDANAGESYEDTQRKRAIAEALMSQPWTARTPGQSIAQAAERIAGALIGRGANKADKAGRARYAEQFEGAMSPFPAAPAAPSGAEPTDYASSRVAQAFGDEGKPDYRSAIAKIESGGRYDAVGPTHAKMGRALGKYQIMESNIGPWSKEALGRTVTADEFLANPQLQDAIFDHKFGGYVNAYGPEGAAQAWLGGPGGVGKTGRKDSLGTSIGEYGQKFMGNLGQPSGGVQKIAQALSGGGQPPEMAGNVGGGGPSQEQLMQLASDPYASDSQKAIVNSLLEQKMRERQMLQEQQMKQSAPDYQLDLQYRQAQLDEMRNPKPDTPASVQEYQFYVQQAQAAGQQPIPYEAWTMRKARAGSGVQDYGNIPSGYMVTRDAAGNPTGVAPIPGSEDAVKAAETQRVKDNRSNAQDTAGKGVVNAAKRALSASKGRVGGEYLQSIGEVLPWTDAAETARQVEVLKSNASIESINAMRQASPTGGALGSVTEKEHAMLAARAGALNPNSPYFERDLKDYTRTLLEVIHGPDEGNRLFTEQFSDAGGQPDQSAVPEGVDPEDWQYMTPEERKLFQ